MDKQQIFDTVINHLLTQGVKSRNGASCLYRGPGGTSCAVGCLIPDEMYVKDMDRQDMGDTTINSVAQKFDLPDHIKDNVDLLTMLQILHDDDDVIFDMRNTHFSERVRSIAITFKLEDKFNV